MWRLIITKEPYELGRFLHYLVFSCEDAAQQVLMSSVCLSVCPSVCPSESQVEILRNAHRQNQYKLVQNSIVHTKQYKTVQNSIRQEINVMQMNT